MKLTIYQKKQVDIRIHFESFLELLKVEKII